MIQLKLIPLKKSINKAYLKVKPVREDLDNFRNELQKLQADAIELEKEIDEMVYKPVCTKHDYVKRFELVVHTGEGRLYGLMEEEIRIVERN